MPAEIERGTFYYVINANTDDFQISVTKNGTALNFTDDGTGTATGATINQPRCRYLSYLADRMFGAGDDGNPSTLYYTDAADTDANDLVANLVVV